MKICFFGIDYPPTRGGISTYTLDWVTQTAEHFPGAVEALFFGNAEPRTEQNGNGELSIRTIRNRGILTVCIRTGLTMLTRPAIAYHALNLFPVGFFVVAWGMVFRKSTVITLYGTETTSQKSGWLARYLKRWTINHATHVIAISDFTAEEVRRRLGIRRSIVRIYPVLPSHGIGDAAAPLNDPRISDDDFLVVSVGRLVRRKGLGDLIDAVAGLSDQYWKVMIIGSGPERKHLQQRVERLHLQSHVLFLGDVEDLRPYYQRANLCVLLSHYMREEGDFEGLGLVLVEAQRYGIPVIGAKSGGIPESFEDGVTGIAISEQDPIAFQAALMKIREKPEIYTNHGMAQAFLESRFSPDKNIATYLEMLQ